MPHITVDGIDYAPVSGGSPTVGVAITTRNRHPVLTETLEAFRRYPPPGPVIVVDDGSQVPVTADVPVFRHDTAQGIPAAKNRCIAELMALGVGHLFLFDDDTRPAAENWWQPYVDSAEPHLQYSWTHSHTGKPVPRMTELYRDNALVSYGWSMGCMLYATAEVINRVGGMRPEFGLGMEEHAEWSRRIHNAGLTTFINQDVVKSEPLVWAADRYGAVTRSIPTQERTQLLQRNERLRISLQDDASFVPYTDRDIILACYFTTRGDAQRGNAKMPATTELLQPLLDSTAGQDVVLITDGVHAEHDGVTTLITDAPQSPYVQRWIRQWQYLRDHPEIRYAWMVDATDVRMLNNPFPVMRPDTLYCGWEPTHVGCDWIRQHSPNTADWVEANAQDMLLNCGVVGGDRATLLWLCQQMVDQWSEGNKADPVEEMVFFNVAARRHHRLVTGIQVTTVFKTNATKHTTAWFAHK